MLTLKESTLVLAKIRAHHGNAPITDLEARTFHEELRGDLTLPLAMEAVRRFYAADATGRWMGSGDVNAAARGVMSSAVPSEKRIGELMESAHIEDPDRMFAYRRRLVECIGSGMGVDAAHREAVGAARTLQLTSRPSKPKKPTSHHFAGRLSLSDVIGRETK